MSCRREVNPTDSYRQLSRNKFQNIVGLIQGLKFPWRGNRVKLLSHGDISGVSNANGWYCSSLSQWF